MLQTVHQHSGTRCHQSSLFQIGRGPKAPRSYPSVTGENPRTTEFLPEHHLFLIQGSDIQTETRSSDVISSVTHNSKPIYRRIRGDCSPHSPQPHPSVWFRYVYGTFTMIHENHVDEFTTHLNSLASNIKFTTEPEQFVQIALPACVNINEDGSTHVTVYRKPTHTDGYLNFSSNNHLQHKRSVVRTLMRRAEVMVNRPDCRRKEMAHIQDALKTNGYKQWMFKVPRPKQQQSTTSTTTRPKTNVGHLRGTHTCVQSTWGGHLPSAHQHHSIHSGTSQGQNT